MTKEQWIQNSLVAKQPGKQAKEMSHHETHQNLRVYTYANTYSFTWEQPFNKWNTGVVFIQWWTDQNFHDLCLA